MSPAVFQRRLRASLIALAGLLASTAPSSWAHELSMAEMQLRETSRGEFIWAWAASEKRGTTADLTPIWPEGCQADGTYLHCGEAGLNGKLQIDGVGRTYSAAMVKVFWLDGESDVFTLTASQPTVQLHGASKDQRDAGQIASAYTLLGIEHILTGFDHLLFVIGLLLLVGFNRRLLWTISAFTLAHSLTLACSALGWLVLRPPPVEASIALSIVLVAGEALHQRQTLARRWPALVAFLFGLVHGLGFAGALKEIGLPEDNLLVALLSFNVGVEIGQLFAVACAWGLWRLCARLPRLGQARTALLYAIGSVAAYWSWLRLVTIFG
jgi:hydrogenase/urease accessory protein HupE